MNKYYLFILLLFSTDSMGVIDLGSLEIEGEVRRPMIQYISSKKRQKNAIYRFIKDEFNVNYAYLVNTKLAANLNSEKHQKAKESLLEQLLNQSSPTSEDLIK